MCSRCFWTPHSKCTKPNACLPSRVLGPAKSLLDALAAPHTVPHPCSSRSTCCGWATPSSRPIHTTLTGDASCRVALRFIRSLACPEVCEIRISCGRAHSRLFARESDCLGQTSSLGSLSLAQPLRRRDPPVLSRHIFPSCEITDSLTKHYFILFWLAARVRIRKAGVVTNLVSHQGQCSRAARLIDSGTISSSPHQTRLCICICSFSWATSLA